MSNSFLLHGWESFVLLEDTGCYAIFPYFVTFQIKRYELSVRNISPRIKRGEKNKTILQSLTLKRRMFLSVRGEDR